MQTAGVRRSRRGETGARRAAFVVAAMLGAAFSMGACDDTSEQALPTSPAERRADAAAGADAEAEARAEAAEPGAEAEAVELIVLPAADEHRRRIESFVAEVRAGRAKARAPSSLEEKVGPAESARAMAATPGGGESLPSALSGYLVLRYGSRASAAAALRALRADGRIRWAGWNAKLKTAAIPNDPYATAPPGQGFSGRDGTPIYQWGLEAMRFTAAWDKTTGHAYVGVPDTGVQLSHPELAANVRPQHSLNFGAGASIDELDGRTGGLGHGTHVAGVIAASTNNGTGVAGGCPGCSLLIYKIVNPDGSIDLSNAATALHKLATSGAQVINLSFGAPDYGVVDPTSVYYAPRNCGDSVDLYHPFCVAMGAAMARDVVLVAAAGNQISETLLGTQSGHNCPPSGVRGAQFPASQVGVIAVAGLMTDVTGAKARWDEGVYQEGKGCPTPAQAQSYLIHYGSSPVSMRYGDAALSGLAAPAWNVLSTMYQHKIWNNAPHTRCGDAAGAPYSGYLSGAGYDLCTGTSMAAPHVTALAGILRSINPLMGREDIHRTMGKKSSLWPTGSVALGVGMPDAAAAVDLALAGTNRLTPLFSLYDAFWRDYFYTTVPQQAAAAMDTSLYPGFPKNLYVPVGTPIDAYPAFPGVSPFGPFGSPRDIKARAQAWVFTTPQNPAKPDALLTPLYRLSLVGNRLDHTLAAGAADRDYFIALGYKLDGIEGYIYPLSEPQPAGTVQLYRRKHPTYLDHAVFTDAELSAMTAAGYTQISNGEIIGYVYRNTGPRPSY